jgi:biopolymer transport protein ExbD
MFHKKSKNKSLTAISTASLPDIIFMLLFFFMVVTTLRTNDTKMKIIVPRASELTKLDNKTLVNYIYIGKPESALDSSTFIIQLGNKIGTVDDINAFIQDHKNKLDKSLHDKVTTSLKIDKDVPMKTIDEVKLALRKANQLRINYIADREVIFEGR